MAAEQLPFVLLGEEEVRLKEENVRYFSDSVEKVGGGTLYLTTRNLRWIPKEGGEKEAWPFQKIVVHAISRDLEAFPHPCIYCQMDCGGDSFEEIRVVPSNESQLDQIFQEFSIIAALNPDEDDDMEEGDDECFFNADEVLSSLVVQENGENGFSNEDERFADAMEDDQPSPKRRKKDD